MSEGPGPKTASEAKHDPCEGLYLAKNFALDPDRAYVLVRARPAEEIGIGIGQRTIRAYLETQSNPGIRHDLQAGADGTGEETVASRAGVDSRAADRQSDIGAYFGPRWSCPQPY